MSVYFGTNKVQLLSGFGIREETGNYQSDKVVTPTESQQEVTPDSNYDALSKVTVQAIQASELSATSNATYTPNSGTYYKKVTVNVQPSPSALSNSIINGTSNINGTESSTDSISISVAIPTGYHEEQTLTKTITDLIPSLSNPGSNATALNGYEYIGADGKTIVGNIPSNGSIEGTIETNGGSISVPSGYTTGGTITASIPISTITNDAIGGTSNADGTGDGIDSISVSITIPEGYYNSTTLQKIFTNLLPALNTQAVASQILNGYEVYDDSGKLMTGTMPNNSPVSTVLDGTTTSRTIQEGYHDGTETVSHVVGSLGTVSASKGTVSGNSVTITPSISGGTAGYISDTSKSGTGVSVSASELVSGNKALSSGTSVQTDIDVTNYKTVSISAISSGTAGTPTASKGSVSNNSITVTPSVTNTTGYITGGTKTGTGVTVSASELVSGNKSLTPSETSQTNIDVTNYATASVSAISSTYIGSGITKKTAQTYTPGTTNQTISSGVYLSGTQTILGDANLVSANIADGVTIFNTTGSLKFQTIYSGSTVPSSSFGENGDIYIKV